MNAPVRVGLFASTGDVTTSSDVVEVAVAAGDVLLVHVGAGSTSAGVAVSDSKGNTWTRLEQATTTVTALTGELWSCVVSVALTTSDTITVTRTPSGGLAWAAYKFLAADVDSTSPFGTPIEAAAASPGSPNAGVLDILPRGAGFFTVAAPTNVTVTPGAGWTALTSAVSSGSGNPRQTWAAYSTADATAAATLSNGAAWTAIAVPVNPSPDPADPWEIPVSVADARIAIIGDSLTYRSGDTASPPSREATTRARFVAGGFNTDNIYWHGVGGKGLVAADTSGKTTLQNITDAVTLLGHVDVWVMALGTNNTGDSDATFVSNMQTVLNAISAAGGGLVVWVNLAFWSQVNANSVRLNPLISSTVADAAGVVLDWNTYIHTPVVASDWIYPTDSTHLTAQGSEKRDLFIIQAVLETLDPATAAPATRTPLRMWADGEGYFPVDGYVWTGTEYEPIPL